MPSADSCAVLWVPCGSLSPVTGTATQVSRGKSDRLLRTTAGSTPVTLDGYGLCDLTLARPVTVAFYPILVHRLAHLLHASFRRHLTVAALALR